MSASPRLNRREVLGLGAAALAAGRLAPGARAGAAAPTARDGARALVVVQLYGGNDGLNTVVPYEDDRYRRLRPATAVTDPLRIAPGVGLHPALPRLHRRYQRGGLRILQGVGYPDPNLSHFKSQDVWDAAEAMPGPAKSGWLGRAFELDAGGLAAGGPLAVCAVGLEAPPLALRGERFVAPAIRAFEGTRLPRPRFADRTRAAQRLFDDLLEVGRPDERTARVVAAQRTMETTLEGVERAAALDARVRYPGTKLAGDLEVCARLLEGGVSRCLWVRQASYDTHTFQARAHERLLRELDGALDAFLADLAEAGLYESTLVLTVSEFGRRVAENGKRGEAGTDHGAGSMLMALGGGVRGGLVGPAPDLDALDADGNLGHDVDFRSVFAAAVGDWLGGDPDAVLGRRWARAELLG